jgi:uncharacterized protein (DUF58 family)
VPRPDRGALPGRASPHVRDPAREPGRQRASGLTARGRCVLAAGLTLAILGWGAGVPDVLRMGAVIAALPAFANLVVRRTRLEICGERQVDPPRVSAGQQARVELRVDNTGRLPTPALLGEETLPSSLGQGPRFTFARVEPGGSRRATYTLPAAGRGRYTLGPLTVRLRDSFGLAEQVRSVGESTHLLVTPAVLALPSVALGGAWMAGTQSGRRSLATHGEDDIGTRPWRDGDDLRRVHWRTTARTGELSVRREEQPWSTSTSVLLDTRAGAHAGDGRLSSFEWAVSAAASVVAHLGARGLPCRLVTSTGRLVDPALPGSPGTVVLLDALATVTPERHEGLSTAASRVLGQAGGVLIAVCGCLSAQDCSDLLASKGQGQGIAVVLDVGSWSPSGRSPSGRPAPETAHALRCGGWDVIVARRGQTLDHLWGQPTGGPSPLGPRPGAGRTAAPPSTSARIAGEL